MSKDWVKIIPIMPAKDAGFMTCGGVTRLDSKAWAKERVVDILSHRPGPKAGEAGSDEDSYEDWRNRELM